MGCGSEQTRRFLASNEKTPDRVLEGLSQDESEAVRELLAENEQAPVRVLWWLLGDVVPEVRDFATNNPRLSGSPLFSLIQRLGGWPTAHLSDVELARLAGCGPFIQKQVASYWGVSSPLLAELANEMSLEVRFAVACHPNTPASVLEKLSKDARPQIRAYAHKHLAWRQSVA